MSTPSSSRNRAIFSSRMPKSAMNCSGASTRSTALAAPVVVSMKRASILPVRAPRASWRYRDGFPRWRWRAAFLPLSYYNLSICQQLEALPASIWAISAPAVANALFGKGGFQRRLVHAEQGAPARTRRRWRARSSGAGTGRPRGEMPRPEPRTRENGSAGESGQDQSQQPQRAARARAAGIDALHAGAAPPRRRPRPRRGRRPRPGRRRRAFPRRLRAPRRE